MNITAAAHQLRNACIVELWSQNYSMGAIAQELQVSRGVVAGVMYRAWEHGEATRRGRTDRIPGGTELRRGGADNGRRAKPVAGEGSKPTDVTRIYPERKGREVSAWAVRARSFPIKQEALPWHRMATPAGREFLWHQPTGCCFIENEDMTAPLFCNAVAIEGKAWCPYHWRRVYQRR